MTPSVYAITREANEDRLAEPATLAEALDIVRVLAKECNVGELVTIEHKGYAVRQFRLTADGRVDEIPVG